LGAAFLVGVGLLAPAAVGVGFVPSGFAAAAGFFAGVAAPPVTAGAFLTGVGLLAVAEPAVLVAGAAASPAFFVLAGGRGFFVPSAVLAGLSPAAVGVPVDAPTAP